MVLGPNHWMKLTSYYVFTSTHGTKTVGFVRGGKAVANISYSFGEDK
jgi:hypothetical protein